MEYQKYSDYILPCQLSEILFKGMVKILSMIFKEKVFIFHMRYQVLNLAKNAKDDYSIYAGIVNQECEKCKLKLLKTSLNA